MTTETLEKIKNNGMSVNKIITIAHEINDMKDIGAREWAIDNFINELIKYFNIDTMSYVDGMVCNDYVNWDSDCGCSIIQASIDFKAIADYLIENDLEPTFDNVSEALCNLEERAEFWTDVINNDIYEINIDALIELMSMNDNKDKGKAEFIADFNEYKRRAEMKTWNDVWKYLCKNKSGHDFMQFYVANPNEVAKAFWHGVLTILEIEGKVTNEDANNIWNEITKGE